MFKGDVIKLLCGVMLIDFVYVIYMWIGLVCVGVKIDGLWVLLWLCLKNGQLVDIIIVEGQKFEVIWIDIVVMGCVKLVICCVFCEEDCECYIKLGCELVWVVFENIGKKLIDKVF